MVRLPAAGKIVPNSDGAAGSDMMELGVRTLEQPHAGILLPDFRVAE